MPNWCQNSLHVEGSTADLAKFKEEAQGYGPRYAPDSDHEKEREGKEVQRLNILNFHSLVPIPEETLEAGYNGRNSVSSGNPKPTSGYDMEYLLWGTKWGAQETSLDEYSDGLMYSFETAWAPPEKWLKHMAPMFPALRFDLSYEESDMEFRGRVVRRGAVVLLDECMEGEDY